MAKRPIDEAQVLALEAASEAHRVVEIALREKSLNVSSKAGAATAMDQFARPQRLGIADLRELVIVQVLLRAHGADGLDTSDG